MTSTISSIHAAAKRLGLDEDTRRAKMMLIVGKSSTKEMTEDERQQVLLVFNGGKPGASFKSQTGARKKLTGKYAGKLQALWIAGWNLGVIRDRDDSALIAFVKRQTGLDAVQFLRFHDDANRAIEAIKAMLKNEGRVNWLKDRFMPPYTQADGFRIAHAQWAYLKAASATNGRIVFTFNTHVSDITGHDPSACSADDWIKVMNILGGHVRHAKGMSDAK